MQNSILKTIIWVTIFAIAMAFLESAVVVYLRALYYPAGFTFPLKAIDNNIAVTEFFREIATIIMLLVAGIIAGRKNIEKFAFFLFSFAVWDIFYYIFLKILIDWPESMFTWDILFMVPVIWVGPVIAPVINSLTMILLAFCIICFVERFGNAKIKFIEWSLLIIGSLIVITSYTEEYIRFMQNKFSLYNLICFANSEEIIQYTSQYIPSHFNWFIFCTGELLYFIAIFIFIKRMSKYKS